MPPPRKEAESKYYGLHACLTLWKVRPKDVIRVYLAEEQVKALRPLLKWCAAQKKAYHIVSEEELCKVTDSVHHEGLCVLAKDKKPVEIKEFLRNITQETISLLYLDGVQNPHNLGSIVRTAAHFGLRYILGERGKLPHLTPSACRVAKGGAEFVDIVHLDKPITTLKELQKKGFSFIGTSSHNGESLYKFRFPKRSTLVMGAESTGISKQLLTFTKQNICIPGTGNVESLNVSVATALCLGEFFREHGQ